MRTYSKADPVERGRRGLCRGHLDKGAAPKTNNRMFKGPALLCLVAVVLSTLRAAAGDWAYTLTIDRGSTNSVAVITAYQGPGGHVAMPGEVDGYPVRAIGNGTRSIDPTGKLTGIVIPDSATSIAGYAFWQPTNLATVTIGAGVRSIGYGAFAYAGKLTELVLPGSVATVGNYAFYRATNLGRVDFGAGLTNIGLAAFSDCPQLAEAVIPEGVVTIGNFAFNFGTGLTNLVLPGTLTNIGRVAFQKCLQLRSVVIPDSVHTIGEEAFARCAMLTNLVLGAGVTNLGRVAFAFCDGLSTVTLGAGVEAVPESLFDGCANLASVVFTGAVTNVGAFALADCPRLTSVFFLGSAPSLAGLESAATILEDSPAAVVYHRPGSLGWGSEWAGRSTAVFQPTAQWSGLTNGTFAFSWSGTGEVPLSVQRQESLISGGWATLTNGVMSGQFTDPQPPVGSAFYRAIYP
jgi:hypothetical protein